MYGERFATSLMTDMGESKAFASVESYGIDPTGPDHALVVVKMDEEQEPDFQNFLTSFTLEVGRVRRTEGEDDE
jgi:hypothetical protein